MPKEQQNTTELRVKIHSKVVSDFREFVENKYGHKHGVLSMEVQNALTYYMRAQKNITHTHTRKEENTMYVGSSPNTPQTLSQTTNNSVLYPSKEEDNEKNNEPETKKKLREILHTAVNTRHMYEGSDLTINDIKDVIRDIAGYDERTIKKYLEPMEKFFLYDSSGVTFGLDADRIKQEWL